MVPYVDAVVDVTDACTVVYVACVYAESVMVTTMLVWKMDEVMVVVMACGWYTWFMYCI